MFLLPFILYSALMPFLAGTAQETRNPIRNASLPDVSPDGRFIAFISERSGQDDLYIMNIDGSSVVRLTNSKAFEQFAGWSSDKRGLFFSVSPDEGTHPAITSQLYFVSVDGKEQNLVTTLPGRGPVVSPDGKLVVYAQGTWRNTRLIVANLDASNPHDVTDGSGNAWNVHWSWDSKQLAFTGPGGERDIAIWVVNADGSGARRVSNVPADEGGAQWPVWSRDGRSFAFQVNSRTQKHTASVWTVDLNTAALKKLSNHSEPYVDETPSWLPDGKRIVFQSDRSGQMELWMMNLDGTDQKQLTR